MNDDDQDRGPRGLGALVATPGRRRLVHVTLSFAALALGALIYILYRPTTLLVFNWIEAVGLEEVVEAMRQSAVGQWDVPGWVLYSLPDMLWVVSFGHAVFAVLVGAKLGLKGYLTAAFIVGGGALGSEIGQAMGWVPGTFDWYDMLFYGLGIIWLVLLAALETKFVSVTTIRRTGAS